MKQLIKAVSALCILFLTYTAALAQAPTVAYTEHAFSYDANGNRVKREQIFMTVFLRTANPDSLTQEQQEENDQLEAFNDNPASFENQPQQHESTRKHDLLLSGHKITAFPNPVNQQLSLEIEITENRPGNTVRLFEMNGKLLVEETLQSSMQLDFSRFAAGTYLLVIYINGKRKEVEIIKN